ncbi:hypothetical protein COO58_16530 [Micromonospora sp. WMMA1996]|uniref:hypothetical protein n=1 Tax=Micromonospora sp. WMMA1996 TaxID=2039878 RepID=UPI000BF56BFD|nr:hypothetical protein [Micromonospora sp. WMMA1996]PGH45855.1 hypothetical protein COO58_16530 [Micromonospora sp. WMMA1996]
MTISLLAAALLLAAACTSPAPGTDVGSSASAPPASASAPPSRKLSAPTTLLGFPKTTSRVLYGAAIQQLEQLKREVGQATSAIGEAYEDGTPDGDVVFVSGASGSIADPAGVLERALRPYRITKVASVDAGALGGEARCGRGRTEDGSYLTTCGWADRETVGVVSFTSSRPQPDHTADFLKVREIVSRPTD